MKSYKYNRLTITTEELNSCALNYAENYWYDKNSFNRPETEIQCFYADFGECDGDMMDYEGLLQEYFTLCEKYRNDPEIIQKYRENGEDDYDNAQILKVA
jgi:hypothetical protein